MKSSGTNTRNSTIFSEATLSGVFVNNGDERFNATTGSYSNGGLAGWLTMDPNVNPDACKPMANLAGCLI